MKGSDRFQTAMLRAVQSQFLPTTENDMKEVGEVLRNELFNLEGPRVIQRALSHPNLLTVERGMTRKPARVRTASIQSAHIRSAGA